MIFVYRSLLLSLRRSIFESVRSLSSISNEYSVSFDIQIKISGSRKLQQLLTLIIEVIDQKGKYYYLSKRRTMLINLPTIGIC